MNQNLQKEEEFYGKKQLILLINMIMDIIVILFVFGLLLLNMTNFKNMFKDVLKLMKLDYQEELQEK